MRLDEWNTRTEDEAVEELLRCCGSTRWAKQMTAVRPFANEETLASVADRVWSALEPADWLEAFAAHPRIGESSPSYASRQTAQWSSEEQGGFDAADAGTARRLAAANREYEARFGYIFIVCATGQSADGMLAMLERRLRNDPSGELSIAAEEQRKITRLRLAKWLRTDR